MKRLAIYVFWEKDGIVRKYAQYFLQELKKVAQELVVVVNGKITKESKDTLLSLNAHIIERANEGLDFWAWKEGLEDIGLDTIKRYDEVILTNCTCYGPIYPFLEMFDVMSKRICDFWAINRHPALDCEFIPGDPETRIISHLQSYFLVFRKNVLNHSAFKFYWDNLSQVKTRQEAIACHEIKLTKYFEDLGFTSDTYMDFEKNSKFCDSNPYFFLSDKQLIEERNPLIKRKNFSRDYDYLLSKSFGNQATNIMNFLKSKKLYDTDMIWDDLLATQKMSDVKTAMHLTYSLPIDYSYKTQSNSKAVLVIYIYYPDQVNYCYEYVSQTPDYFDVFVVVSSNEAENLVKERFKSLKCNNFEIRRTINRGRDVSVCLIVCADVFSKYDYVCFAHDKKCAYAKEAIIAQVFRDHCFENKLKSRNYINNIVDLFEKTPDLVC